MTLRRPFAEFIKVEPATMCSNELVSGLGASCDFRHLLAVPWFRLRALTPVGLFHSRTPRSGTLFRIWFGTRRAVQTVSDVYLPVSAAAD